MRVSITTFKLSLVNYLMGMIVRIMWIRCTNKFSIRCSLSRTSIEHVSTYICSGLKLINNVTEYHSLPIVVYITYGFKLFKAHVNSLNIFN